MAVLSKSEIENALARLGQMALEQGVKIELVLVGGALMVLAFDARPSTRDVDAVILAPREARIVRKMAAAIADEYGWPDDWLNDGAKGFMMGISSGPIVFSAPGIEVRRPDLSQLLAMKISAWRDDVDIADARRLLKELESDKSKDSVWDSIEPYLPPGRELKAQYAFMDLWEELYG